MLKKIILLCCLLSLQNIVYAQNNKILIQNLLEKHQKNSIEQKISIYSTYFLGKPYILHPLGEGYKAVYDQKPLIRFDGFDCLTYVETVIAMAISNNLYELNNNLNKIRYHNAHISFITRNHFTSIDWNINNQKIGLLKDITKKITLNKKPIYKYSITVINKSSWYKKLPKETIYLNKNSQKNIERRWYELKKSGALLPTQTAKIPYIPLNKIFIHHNVNTQILKQIPNASIVEIVRPNWQTKDLVGTNLDVSHLGFAIWKNNMLFYRNASSIYNKIIDVPMVEYLKNALNSKTIKGINIQIINLKPHVK